MQSSQLLTVEEAARRLGVSRATIERHIRDGEFGTINVGRGSLRPHIRLLEEELEDFVARRYQKHVPAIHLATRPSAAHPSEEYDILKM